MKPVYFPYTYVSPALAEQWRPFFRSLAVYQPIPGRLPEEMRAMQSQGFLEVTAPPPGDEERLESVARQFLDWGALHRQGVGIRAAGSAPSGGGGASPAFDEETCARIVAEVKRGSQPSDASPGFDPLVPARLFLHLAQEFDRQSRELQSELDGLARRTAELFDTLKGRAAPLEGASGFRRAETPHAHADYLIENRLSAWSRLYLNRPYPSAVFLTHHAAVVAQVLEKMPAARRVLPGEGGLPALEAFCAGGPPSGDLMAELQSLAAAPVTAAAAADGGCGPRAVYVWPGVAPQQLWAGCRLAPAAGERPSAAGPNCRNTLLVVAAGEG